MVAGAWGAELPLPGLVSWHKSFPLSGPRKPSWECCYPPSLPETLLTSKCVVLEPRSRTDKPHLARSSPFVRTSVCKYMYGRRSETLSYFIWFDLTHHLPLSLASGLRMASPWEGTVIVPKCLSSFKQIGVFLDQEFN